MPSITDVHDSILTSKPQTKTLDIGLALDISELVLAALTTAAKLSKIPYVQDAASQALCIVKIIQGVRSNKDAFRRLGNDACELVYAILLTVDESSPTSAALLDNLRELLRKLAEIERFALKEKKRGLVIRTIKHKSDLETINEYREKLKQSLDVFGLKSSISIQENIVLMQKNLEEINEREKRREAAEKAKAALALKEAEEERAEKERLRREEEAKRKQYNEEAVWEKLEKERKERERLLYSIAEQERREEKQRLEVIRLEEERLKESGERIRKEKEKLERIEQEKLERQRERLAQERIELERLEWKAQKEKEEKEKADKERLELLRWEQERHRAEKERAERARLEEERAARMAHGYPSPGTTPFAQSPFTSPYYPPGFDHSFANLNLNAGVPNHPFYNAGVPNPFYNTGVHQNNSGNTTTNITTNSNNDRSVNVTRSPKKKKKSE